MPAPLTSGLGTSFSTLGGMFLGEPLPSFELTSASAIDYQTVVLTFNDDLLDNATLVDPASYSINQGLTVTEVSFEGLPNQVTLTTTSQTQGTDYTVTVTGHVVNTNGNSLLVNDADFTGFGVGEQYVVTESAADSVCSGQAIRLSWKNPTAPTAPTQLLIVRRLKAWPFDLTDDYTIVYQGSATDADDNLITEFYDTGIAEPITGITADVAESATVIPVTSAVGYSEGDSIRIESTTGPVTFDLVTIATISGDNLTVTPALANAYTAGETRVAESTVLQPQTYYYYLVLVSYSAQPQYAIADDSQVMGLSIAQYNGKSFWWNNFPTVYKTRDAMPQTQINVGTGLGGGGGFLQEYADILGCWLNLMRGMANSIQLLNDPDQAPFHTLPALNMALGIDPEGYGYDYDIVRRPLTSLIFVYKRKGSCPGLVETVRMFTKWNATCVDFGAGACAQGAINVTTWDGVSQNAFGSGPVGTQITQVVQADGSAIITDTSATLTPDLFDGGTLRGWIGDLPCVSVNTATAIHTVAPTAQTNLTNAAAAGVTSFQVNSTEFLTDGMTIQIWTAGLAEIVQIYSITPGAAEGDPGTISIQGPGLLNSYPEDAGVSLGFSIVRMEYLGSSNSVGSGTALTDPQATWVQNQWNGYQLLDSGNHLFDIVSNTGNELTVASGTPDSGAYSIAPGFTTHVGGFADRVVNARYKLESGTHTGWFEPTFDLKKTGTIYDPNNPLYGGPGLSLGGSWGPGNVGLYITTPVAVLLGRSSGTSGGGTVFALDPTQVPPGDGTLVGMWLNPDQNQEQFFQITSNTTTTVTVGEDISTLVDPGQIYVVLRPRDKTRYDRVVYRLRNEFSDEETSIHVLFA